ncbi:histidinol-phosphatase [Chloroflexota bacterium]
MSASQILIRNPNHRLVIGYNSEPDRFSFDRIDISMAAPILYDSHMHTHLCQHAYDQPTDYAQQAAARGLKGIVFTCHNPTENNAFEPGVRMRVDQFEEYVQLIEATRQQWQGRVDVRLGLESDYFPGHEDWLAELYDRAEFDYILGSIHPQLLGYWRPYHNGDPVAFQRTYFEHLAMSAESGLFDCLGHPDQIKNVPPTEWSLDRIMPDIIRALDRIAATGVAMELNTYGLHRQIKEMHPAPAMLVAMKKRDIPIVLGSDAHNAQRVAADFENALDLLTATGYTTVTYFLKRQRHTVALDTARASLRNSQKSG